MSRPAFEIHACRQQERRFQDAYDVRVKVFVDEQKFSLDEELDDYDPVSLSLVLYVDTVPVGTIRFTPSIGKISRLAVLASYRKYGFGKELILAAERQARESGSERLVIHSQIPVLGFYERLGYRAEGERFDEDGAPHQKMIKTLELHNV